MRAMTMRLRIAAWAVCCTAVLALFLAWNPLPRLALLRLAPLGWALALFAACCGIGWLVARRDLLVATAYGIGIVGGIVFLAGLLHALRAPLFLAVIVIGDALCAVALVRSRVRVPQIRPPLAAAMLVAMLVVVVPMLALPETSFDADAYHLLVPRLYLEHGGIVALPLLTESNYPSLNEYLYLVLLAVSGEVAAKCFHFLCAIALGAAMTRLARGSLLPAALFFTMPVAAICAAWAWNDMLFTLFVVLSLAELLERRMLSAGVLFGLATATKYTFVLTAIGIAAVLVRGLLKREWTLRDVVRFAAPLLAIAAVWMTKNAAMAGNPIAPFPHPSPALHASLVATEQTWDWRTLPLWPFVMTLRARLIDVQPGVLPLLLLPFAFVRRRDARASAMGTYAIAVAIGWMLVRTVVRSLLSMFAVLLVLEVDGLEAIASDAMKRVARVVIVCGTIVNVLMAMAALKTLFDPQRYLFGLETRAQFIDRHPTQRVYLWLDTHAEVRRVLLVDINTPFQLAKPAVFSGRFDKPVAQALVEAAPSPDALAHALAAAGVTHVAVDRAKYSQNNASHLYSWSDAQRAVFAAFLRTKCRLVAQLGDDVVFALQPVR
jgi:hypothetical protein